MNKPYRISTDKSWLQTEDELTEEFRRWGVGKRDWSAKKFGRGAVLRWMPKGSHEAVTITSEDQYRPEDNLRKLFKLVQDLRGLEMRGYSQQVASYYAQTTALTIRDEDRRDVYAAYTMLGVRPDADLESIEAVKNSLLKRYHPDRYQGEDGHEKAVAINLAWDEIQRIRRVS